MRKSLLVLCLSLLTLPVAAARADSWLPPSPKIYASTDGSKPLKVVPGQGIIANASWVTMAPDGTVQEAKPFPLVNIPVTALVPGRFIPYFVTLNTYSKVGYEHSLVIYRDNGEVVRDFKLEDLLTPKEIKEHALQTVASRFWDASAKFDFVIPKVERTEEGGQGRKYQAEDEENVQLHIVFPWGKQMAVRLKDGEVTVLKEA
ncbi:hypothetical protein EON80_11910 [bacterium]|nr:MAG: hypothetical protein EON80_11910 [bacterium]